MPNMSHCQITRNTRFARHVGIIKPNPNPTTNPNPNLNHNPNRNRRNKYSVNKHLRTRLRDRARAMVQMRVIWYCDIFNITPEFWPWCFSYVWANKNWNTLVPVCLFVCLYSHISETAQPNFTKFLSVLPAAVARSCSDGAAICYVLPILWMTSYCHIMGSTWCIMCILQR